MNRTKRKRRRKKVEIGAALTGSERVKVIDLRTGKKVRKAKIFAISAIINTQDPIKHLFYLKNM